MKDYLKHLNVHLQISKILADFLQFSSVQLLSRVLLFATP